MDHIAVKYRFTFCALVRTPNSLSYSLYRVTHRVDRVEYSRGLPLATRRSRVPPGRENAVDVGLRRAGRGQLNVTLVVDEVRHAVREVDQHVHHTSILSAARPRRLGDDAAST